MFIFTAEQARQHLIAQMLLKIDARVENALSELFLYIKDGVEKNTLLSDEVRIGKYESYRSNLDVWIHNADARSYAVKYLQKLGYKVELHLEPTYEYGTIEQVVISW